MEGWISGGRSPVFWLVTVNSALESDVSRRRAAGKMGGTTGDRNLSSQVGREVFLL